MLFCFRYVHLSVCLSVNFNLAYVFYLYKKCHSYLVWLFLGSIFFRSMINTFWRSSSDSGWADSAWCFRNAYCFLKVQKFEASGSTKEDSVTEIDKLTQQLCESESQRLDLEDRVQALEEELERVNAQTVAAEDKPCDETLQAKDHYIAKVEKEKKDAELELQKMVLFCKMYLKSRAITINYIPYLISSTKLIGKQSDIICVIILKLTETIHWQFDYPFCAHHTTTITVKREPLFTRQMENCNRCWTSCFCFNVVDFTMSLQGIVLLVQLKV